MPSSTKDQANSKRNQKTVGESRMTENCVRCRLMESQTNPISTQLMLTICFIVTVGFAVIFYQLHVGKENTQQLYIRLEKGTQELYDRLDATLQENRHKQEQGSEEFYGKLQRGSQECQNKLETRTLDMYVRFEKRLEEQYDQHKKESLDYNTAIETGLNEHYNRLLKALRELGDKLGTASQDIFSKLEKRSQQHHDKQENTFQVLYEAVVYGSQERYQKLEKGSQELLDKLEKRSQELINTLERKLQDNDVLLDNRLRELYDKLNTDSQGHYENLDMKLQEHHNSLKIASQEHHDKLLMATQDHHGKRLAASNEPYDKLDITNQADYAIRHLLDQAESLLDQGLLEQAFRYYGTIVTLYPESPRGLLGHARAASELGQLSNGDSRTGEAIRSLEKICLMPSLKRSLFTMALKMLYETKVYNKTPNDEQYKLWNELYKRYPDFIEVQRIFGHILNRQGHYSRAIIVLHQVVDRDASDALSSARLGTIYHKRMNDSSNGAKYLQNAFDIGFPPGHCVKAHYYDLSIAYNRLNETEKELQLIDKAVEKGALLSYDQRSIHNCERSLPSQPWWTMEQTTYQGYFKKLEDNWETIRDEAMALLDQHTGLFRQQTEGITEKGDWRYLLFYRNGKRQDDGCELAPKTCALFDNFTAATSCTRGQVKLSIMQPGVHVWPHSGPTNCRIRAHLGLVVPEGPRIKVGNETRTWTEGRIMVFDDSFLHEVWHDGQTFRMILIIDVWHPSLTQKQRDALKPV